jgi:hypothetical protein
MQNTFLFEAMKETHEQQKTKIDIDELFTGTTNITLIIPIICQGISDYWPSPRIRQKFGLLFPAIFVYLFV